MNIFAPDYGTKLLHMAEGGNALAEDYTVQGKPGAGDKLYFGIIQAGVRVHAVQILSGAAGAGASVKVGFEPADNEDPRVADDDYFIQAGASLATAGAVSSASLPITFDYPVKLVATVGATAFANDTKLVAIVTGKVVGVL